jgi:hypothetical protein
MEVINLSKIKIWLLLNLVLGLNLLMFGCAETRSSQCQKIFNIAEEATKKTEKLTQNGNEIDQTAWLTAADEIEESAEEMKKIEITDKNLQKYQSGFIQVYQDYASATREIVKILDSKDIVMAKAAQEKVKRAGQLERELATEINSYCQRQ